MGSYYTLHTIFNNWFYVQNTMKIPVLVSSNQFQPVAVWTGLDLQSFTSFGPVFLIWPYWATGYGCGCIKIWQKNGLDWTLKYYPNVCI